MQIGKLAKKQHSYSAVADAIIGVRDELHIDNSTFEGVLVNGPDLYVVFSADQVHSEGSLEVAEGKGGGVVDFADGEVPLVKLLVGVALAPEGLEFEE